MANCVHMTGIVGHRKEWSAAITTVATLQAVIQITDIVTVEAGTRTTGQIIFAHKVTSNDFGSKDLSVIVLIYPC